MDTDLHDRLDRLAGPAAPPGPDTLEADLTRGRTALRRRRLGRLAGASGLAAAVLAAALAYPAVRDARPAAPAGTGTAGTTATVHLVAYTGTQPAGFTIDEVPQGWEVQGVDRYGLTLAPVGIADREPDSFVGKIAIMAQRSVPGDVARQDVTVQGRPALLVTMKDDTRPSTLFVRQDNGVYLVIQVWESLGWTGGDIVRFGGGVHMQPGALDTAG
ncbi:hypothetical protein [Dactylosporangium sp. NPDC049140]|uniref:hypothetical protein n=1 Tax=Dactylosporangium sp. NPDC049140 TaxID=3155647 RepID=UPI00340F7A40